MRRAPFDLAYNHEMVALATAAVAAPDPRSAARDLTARLRCLKALLDAERGAPSPRRVH